MLRILFAAGALVLLFTVPALADVGPNSIRYKFAIERCYEIQNTDEYPGYVFGVAPWPDSKGGFVAFNKTRCFMVTNVTHQSRVYAMQDSEYYRLAAQDPGQVPYDSAIPSGYPAPLPSFGTRFSYEPDNQTDSLKIMSLNKSVLVLKTVRTSFLFRDGQIDNQDVVTEPSLVEGTITPAKTPLASNTVILAVIITMGIIMVSRKMKES
jgi:hypothetical protein